MSRAALHGLAGGRLVTAHAVILLVLSGSLLDIVTGREHWPFSPYAMFSHTHRMQGYVRRRLYGVTAEGTEIALRDNRYLQPMDISRMGVALERLERRRNAARMRDALDGVLRRYETLRLEGRHGGPWLRAIRLYKVTWKLDRKLKNLDAPRSKVLLAASRSDGER